MSEQYIPTPEEVERFVIADMHGIDLTWMPEYVRRRQAEAWEEAWIELRAIPHWWNPEEQRGGFDLQDGPVASEEGAYMAVRRVMLVNPYRQGENNEHRTENFR